MSDNKLRVVIHDVGHGQAVYALTPAGEHIVIDLGRSESFSPLEWLKSQTSTIDYLVITHPHGDHIDEILDLDRHGFRIRQLWRPSWLPKEEVYKQNQSSYTDKLDAYYKLSDRFTNSIQENERVGNPAVSGGVSIDVFASTQCGVSNINNHSGVVVLNYSKSKIIISGDNEPPSWGVLSENVKFKEAVKNADIFMASHHGRVSGYDGDLFKIFKPALCAISDGRVRDTDATSRYSGHATGWLVHKKKDATKETRNCVTTRSDGYIDVTAGVNPDGKNFLQVQVP